jgi:hypothetical protein
MFNRDNRTRDIPGPCRADDNASMPRFVDWAHIVGTPSSAIDARWDCASEMAIDAARNAVRTSGPLAMMKDSDAVRRSWVSVSSNDTQTSHSPLLLFLTRCTRMAGPFLFGNHPPKDGLLCFEFNDVGCEDVPALIPGQ